jgi:hypothetical protein
MEKDLKRALVQNPVTDRHVITMIDVDYHVDMKHWMSYERPIVMYTFTPGAVAGRSDDGTYWVTGDNRVHLAVKGAQEYCHTLWDYRGDFVVARYWTKTVVYTVDRQILTDDRSIITLIPYSTVKGPWGWYLPGREMMLRELVQGDFAVSQFLDEEGDLKISLAMLDSPLAATLSLGYFHLLQIKYGLSSKPTSYDISEYLRRQGMESDEAATVGPQLCAFYKNGMKISQVKTQTGGSPARVVRPSNYVVIKEPIQGPVVEIGRQLMPPVVDHPALAPASCRDNDVAAVEGRIYAVLNDKIPPERYHGWANDFLDRLVEAPAQGLPLDASDVIELQDEPLQRGRNEKIRPWMAMEPSLVVKAFMKKEPMEGGDPRNISQCDVTHCIVLSRYTYAFKREVLLGQAWYAPGCTPREVAERVVALAGRYQQLVETDYSRFDGTISRWLRTNVEKAAYQRYFGGMDGRQVGELIDKEIDAMGVTASGMVYDPSGSRLSGSPLTTDGNTIINAFADYCALRLMGLLADEAFFRLGLYCGDDGVSNALPACLERVAEELGLRLKCEVRRDGAGDHAPALSFLNRHFEDPWGGSLGSVQNPLRALRKIHMSFAPGYITDQQALYDKANGYLALDPDSPLMGAICRAMKRVAESESNDDDLQNRLTSYDTPFFIWAQYLAQKDDHTGSQDMDLNTWPQADVDWVCEYTAYQIGCREADVLDWIELYDLVEIRDHMEAIERTIHVAPLEEKIPIHVLDNEWESLPDWAKIMTQRAVPVPERVKQAEVKKTTAQKRARRRAFENHNN